MKLLKSGVFLFSTILVFVFHLSFLRELPFFLDQFNLILVFLLLVLFFGSFGLAVNFAFSFGFLFDIYSFHFFGFYLFSYVLLVIFANYLLKNFFTNQSFYSLLGLTVFASVIFSFLNFIFYFGEVFVLDNYFKLSFSFFLFLFIEIFYNTLFSCLSFGIIKIFKKYFSI